jgi:uncharacterized protein (TIGR02145 family)
MDKDKHKLENMKNRFLLIAVSAILVSITSAAQVTGTFTDVRDGKIYKTVKIGAQTWMAGNLAYKVDTGCWTYGNDPNSVKIYGYLYDWETAKRVCPRGWHLPSDEEWTTLVSYLGGDTLAGGKMKETDTIHWKSPNADANNKSRFTALPGGYRASPGGMYYLGGESALWWSSTGKGKEDAYGRCLYNYNGIIHQERYLYKHIGVSVRCVKD